MNSNYPPTCSHHDEPIKWVCTAKSCENRLLCQKCGHNTTHKDSQVTYKFYEDFDCDLELQNLAFDCKPNISQQFENYIQQQIEETIKNDETLYSLSQNNDEKIAVLQNATENFQSNMTEAQRANVFAHVLQLKNNHELAKKIYKEGDYSLFQAKFMDQLTHQKSEHHQLDLSKGIYLIRNIDFDHYFYVAWYNISSKEHPFTLYSPLAWDSYDDSFPTGYELEDTKGQFVFYHQGNNIYKILNLWTHSFLAVIDKDFEEGNVKNEGEAGKVKFCCAPKQNHEMPNDQWLIEESPDGEGYTIKNIGTGCYLEQVNDQFGKNRTFVVANKGEQIDTLEGSRVFEFELH